MKVSNEQILALSLQVEAGKITITQGCKQLHITRKTYYDRMAKIEEEQRKLNITIQRIETDLPLTIMEIQNRFQKILKHLDTHKKGACLEDSLAIIDREIKLLVPIFTALNRVPNIHLHKTMVFNNLSEEQQEDIANQILKGVVEEYMQALPEARMCPFGDRRCEFMESE